MEGSPGSEPIGGDRAEPGAELRGWITVHRRPFNLVPGSPLFIAHHPFAGPLKIAASMDGMVGMDKTGTRLRYRVNALPGSAGAPCFDANWELIAMHQAMQEGYGQGVAISALVGDLQSRGLAELLTPQLV